MKDQTDKRCRFIFYSQFWSYLPAVPLLWARLFKNTATRGYSTWEIYSSVMKPFFLFEHSVAEFVHFSCFPLHSF